LWKVLVSLSVLAVITPLILGIFSQINPKPTLTGSESLKGITIKYPLDDWKSIKPSDDFIGEVIQFIPTNEKQLDSCTIDITISVQDLSTQLLSLEEYKNLAVERIKNNNPNKQITDVSKDLPTLSKFKAYKLIYTRQEGQCKLQAIEVGTVRNKKAYFITYTADSAKYSQYLPIAEAVIQSFQIIENN
jgi:eukaryotic-like serine/threonine-protein kinase